MIRFAICDDEIVFIEQIRQLLQSALEERNIPFSIECFISGKELCAALEGGSSFDVLYLDIHMEGMDGLETADRLRNQFNINHTILIYVSSYDDQVKDVFQFDTFRFLSKPINKDLFKKELTAACDRLRLKRNELKVFSFKDVSGDEISLDLTSIVYFSINRHKLDVITNTACYSFYGKIDEIDEQLEDLGFLRIHKSHLINFSHIASINYQQVTMSNHSKLDISGPKRKVIRTKYLQLRAERADHICI